MTLATDEEIEEAMWAGDVDLLHEIAPCTCCCWEHTSAPNCPAFAWGACRGQHSTESWDSVAEGYAEFYMRTRNMTREEFFDWGELYG